MDRVKYNQTIREHLESIGIFENDTFFVTHPKNDRIKLIYNYHKTLINIYAPVGVQNQQLIDKLCKYAKGYFTGVSRADFFGGLILALYKKGLLLHPDEYTIN